MKKFLQRLPQWLSLPLCICLGIITLIPAASAGTIAGLRAYYTFAGGTGSDSSGNYLNANVNGITITPGPTAQAGDAAVFNGNSSSVEVNAVIEMKNQQTIAAWIKPEFRGELYPIVAKAVPGWGGETDCWLHLLPGV